MQSRGSGGIKKSGKGTRYNRALAEIRFFYDAHKETNRINPLGTWLIGNEKDFPIIYDDLSKIQKKD